MIYFFVSLFLLSFVLTAYVRRYALAKNIVDVPNHRSSHGLPTPRGGGLAFIAVFFVSLPCLYYAGYLLLAEALILFLAGFLIAALGFWDDQFQLSMRLRLAAHFFAALFAVYWLHGIPSLSFIAWALPGGLFLKILAVFYLVWLINLYNFMDGIDGLAAIEAITVCGSAIFIAWLCSYPSLMALPLSLAVVVAGFLCWNFPPARLFMGDAGSGFLGLVLGFFSLQAGALDPALFWAWLILLGVFIVDASVTLVLRLVRGYGITAHREHAYQHAVRRYGRHRRVTLGVCALNLGFLFPLAILVAKGILTGMGGLLLAYFPLFVLALWFKAGQIEDAL
jgi:Fuc2NAc and GlcNAc transferase